MRRKLSGKFRSILGPPVVSLARPSNLLLVKAVALVKAVVDSCFLIPFESGEAVLRAGLSKAADAVSREPAVISSLAARREKIESESKRTRAQSK